MGTFLGNLKILVGTVKGHKIENSRAHLGYKVTWSTVGAQLKQKQLGHSWCTISGLAKEKLVWAQLRRICLGHSWGRVKVKVSVKVRN